MKLFRLCVCVFFGCLTVGISLGTLPAFIHEQLHFSNLVVGIVIGLQSAATLASRHYSGSMCDRDGSRRAVRLGCGFAFISGLVYLLSLWLSGLAAWGLVLMLAARILMGLGESLYITGALAWGISLLGHQRSGKVMAWVGIAIYGAVACGAPLGLLLRDNLGLGWSFGLLAMSPMAGWLVLRSLPEAPASGGARVPFYLVMGKVAKTGVGLALGTMGFCGLAAFASLYFASEGWKGAGLALTVFGLAYIVVRLFFAHLPDRLGGARVAIVSLLVEALGQVLLWKAGGPGMALVGAALTGTGFSLVFPSFGVEAVKQLGPANRGAALGAYVAFFDLAMGVTAPLAGWVAGRMGYPAIFCMSAGAACFSLLIALSLMRRTAPAAEKAIG